MINLPTPMASTSELVQTVDELNNQAAAWQFSDPVYARSLAEKALRLAQSNPCADTQSRIGIGKSLTILVRCCIEMADYAAAIEFGSEALAIRDVAAVGHHLPEIMGKVAYAYTQTGQYVDSLRYFLQQQQVSKEQGNRKLEASAYVGRGLIYSFSGDHEKAIEALQTSLQIFQALGDPFGQSMALTNLCHLYQVLGNAATSLDYGFRALVAIEEAGTQEDLDRVVYCNMGAAYVQLRDYPAARAYLEKALAPNKVQDPTVVALAHLELGRLHNLQADPANAITHLQVATAVAAAQGQSLIEYAAHEALAQVYQSTGELDKVVTHLQQFHTIRDSVYHLQNRTRLGTVELEQEIEVIRREATISKRLTAELERQVQERTAALRASLDRETHLSQELERALVHEAELQQLKTHIINTASHEFRTPLSIISLSMEMLCDRAEQLSPEKRGQYRNRVREQILYLTDMLQDIFAINTSNDVEPEYASYQFADFCQQLEQTLLRELHHSAAIRFVYADSNTLLATDFQIVKHILFNLIVNAIKFSEVDAQIKISCEHSRQHLVIRVVDQGIGIPPGEQKKIFDLFYRASNVDTRRGLGLGLSIVQKLTTTLKGTIYAESAGLDQGSTFHLHLPITQQTNGSRVLLG